MLEIDDSQAPIPPAHDLVTDDGALLDAYSQAVVAAASRITPSVVNIEVTQARAARRGRGEERGTGSGFFFTPDGFLLTNSHVVSGAAAIEVTTSDGVRYEATLCGDDPHTDLAVLRISAPKQVAATLGDAKRIQPGQLVVAVGNPYGFQCTVTAGGGRAAGRATGGPSGRRLFHDLPTPDAPHPRHHGGPPRHPPRARR